MLYEKYGASMLVVACTCAILLVIYSALYFAVARSAEGRLPGRLHCLGFSASAFLAPFSGQREVASALKI